MARERENAGGKLPPLSITFDDGRQTTINKCTLRRGMGVRAGQSMEMPVRDSATALWRIQRSGDGCHEFKGIHYAKVPSTMGMTPQEDAQCKWKRWIRTP